ncbi:MAG: ABC transporter substrate-binding protein [Elusimicrobiota bacterium]
MRIIEAAGAAALLLVPVVGARPAAAASTDTLVVCDDVQDPMTLDPQKEFSEKNHVLLQQAYESLVRFDADGRIVPSLAVSWERLGPLRLRFKLRRGVRFHDGEPFDSRAVVYTIERYLDPAVNFPGRPFLGPIEKAEAVDAETVDIVTAAPDGILLNRLAWLLQILAPDFIKNNGEAALQTRTAGTGPFKLESWDRGRQITYVRNEDHWRKPGPSIRRLIFRFIPVDAQVDALLDGRVDLLTDLPGLASMRVRKAGMRVLQAPSFYTSAASYDVSRPPMSDLRVRKALNMAIDREELVRYDAHGSGTPLATLTMPGEGGHDDSLKPYRYDPKEARKLLKEAGYPNGFKLKVFVKVQAARTFSILSAMLARIGVQTEATEFTDAELLDGVKAQNWDMMFGSCPDPMYSTYFIQAIFLYSRSPFAKLKDPEYDRRLEQAAATVDPARRDAAFADLDRYMYDNALVVSTYQRMRTLGAAPGVDFAPSLSGVYYFDRASWRAPNAHD